MKGTRKSLAFVGLLLVFCVTQSKAQESGEVSGGGGGAEGGDTGGQAETTQQAATSPTNAASQPQVETTQQIVTTPDQTTAAPVETVVTTAPVTSQTVTQEQTQVATQQQNTQVTQATTRQTTVQNTAQTAVAQTTVVNGGVTVVSSIVQAATTPVESGMVTSVRPTSVAMQVQTADAGSVIIVVEGLTTTVAPESASDVQASISSASLAGTLNNDSSSNDDGGSSNKVWIIPVAVIGGIVGLCALAYIAFRLFRNRFKGLDADGDMIKWPELKTSTDDVLMPQGARHVAGAGVDFGSDDGEDHAKSPALSRNSSVMFGAAGSQQHGSQGHQQYYDNRSSYYDPYLGQQQETVERRPSNLSYASRLPPGASSPIPTSRPFSPAGATTASVYDDYRSNTPHIPEDHSLLDRNGTVRSAASSGQKLGIANPSMDGH